MNSIARHILTAGVLCAAAALTLAVTPRAFGQTAPATPPSAESNNASTVVTTTSPEEQPVEMSPFIVDTSADKGSYQANSTLAGTRVRTDINDIASSLSVITAQFLQDTGATNSQSLQKLGRYDAK